MKFHHVIGFATAALLACAAPSSATESTATAASQKNQSDMVPFYTNLGSHHKRISTKVPAAQQYFDQGLRLVYGFNHAEAIRSFARAAELDPNCAMCYWGIALAYGPHVNAPMDAASGVAAYEAVQKALSLKAHATATERAYIENLLKKRGYEVIVAESGEQGIEKAKSGQPDLILMDVVMPGLNGFQATRAITREESTKHIPVIICTTKDQETDKIWGLRQGAKDYVTKPLDETDLIEKIKALG
jgi:twitching motility two-component system response regulator PilH